MVKNYVKKPKKTKNQEKNDEKKFQFFSGHPSKYWLGSMLLNLRVTKWPSKNDLKMLIVFVVGAIEEKERYFCVRTKTLIHTLILLYQKFFSYSQKALIYAKCQKKPQISPKGVVEYFYLRCLLITHILVWAGVIAIALVHFII